MELESELAKWLLLCARVLKSKDPNPVDDEIVSIWATILKSENVTVLELNLVFQTIIKRETFFPTPAEFLKRLDRVRPSPAFLGELVELHTGELESRKLADKLGHPYYDPKKEALSLPEPPNPEVRKEATERLAKAEAIALKCKREKRKAVDVLAESKALPAPATIEEIEKKRELFRKQAGVA